MADGMTWEAGKVSGSETQISAESEIIKPSPPPLSQPLQFAPTPRESVERDQRESDITEVPVQKTKLLFPALVDRALCQLQLQPIDLQSIDCVFQ